ncbi:MAG: DUF4199 domain-containing protein [Sphingorhabdus lacus]
MGRIILVYGVIAGVTVAILMRIAMMLFPEGGTGGMIAGFSSMIIALSFVFIGVKRYRDIELGGIIRFWRALGVGFAIAFIASLFYVAAWELYLYFTNYTFMDEYISATLEQAKSQGKTATELATMAREMDSFRALYANPFSRMAVTFTEISPIAVLMPLISAALLRNSRFLPLKAATA